MLPTRLHLNDFDSACVYRLIYTESLSCLEVVGTFTFLRCTQSVVIPTRRATANAFQMLVMHAFGDAISPFIIGTIADAQRTPDSVMSRYLGMQQALLMNVFICIISGFVFLCASWYIESAKARVLFIVEASRVEHFSMHEAEVEAERRPLLPVDDNTTPQPNAWLSFTRFDASHYRII